jgi:predicted membrane channel-forming protein YqfA (hemolysin III family)
LISRNSITAFCALTASSEWVNTFMPLVTMVAQAGIGFGAFSTCTRHMRQLAAMDSFLW